MSLKVIHIAPTPFFSDRGCHIRIRNQIEALQGSQVSTILCTYHLGLPVEGIDTRRTARIPGYTKLDAGFSPFKFLADILLFFLVLRTAYREKADILHGHLHEGALIGWAVQCCLFWRNLPLIMDMQGSLSGELIGYGAIKQNSLLARVVVFVERLICKMPQLFFCSSENCRELLIHTFNVPIEKVVPLTDVVPDAFLAPRKTAPLRQQLGIPEDKTVIIYSGSLLPAKGVDHILESIKVLHQQRQDLFFILVGYPVGNARKYLETHGLNETVLLTDRVAYCDLAGWLAVAEIALDPKEEATGEASGKILHYMAAGLPVVCFDTLNNHSLLGELGYYAKRGETSSFVEMIHHAIDDRNARVIRGESGCNVIRQTYSFGVVRNILLEQYGHLHNIKNIKCKFRSRSWVTLLIEEGEKACSEFDILPELNVLISGLIV